MHARPPLPPSPPHPPSATPKADTGAEPTIPRKDSPFAGLQRGKRDIGSSGRRQFMGWVLAFSIVAVAGATSVGALRWAEDAGPRCPPSMFGLFIPFRPSLYPSLYPSLQPALHITPRVTHLLPLTPLCHSLHPSLHALSPPLGLTAGFGFDAALLSWYRFVLDVSLRSPSVALTGLLTGCVLGISLRLRRRYRIRRRRLHAAALRCEPGMTYTKAALGYYPDWVKVRCGHPPRFASIRTPWSGERQIPFYN